MVENILVTLLRSFLGVLLSGAILVGLGSSFIYAQIDTPMNRDGASEHEGELSAEQKDMLEQEAPHMSDQIEFSPQERVALHFVEQGQAALSQDDFDHARIFFERAIEVAPLQPYSYYFLGRLTFAQGDANQALTFLLKAELLLSAENTDWLGETTCLQGTIHEDSGEYEKARFQYRRCLEFSPQNLRAITALARLPEEIGP